MEIRISTNVQIYFLRNGRAVEFATTQTTAAGCVIGHGWQV